MTTELLEKVARAMAPLSGGDADDIMANGGRRWRYYEPLARAAIAAAKGEKA